VSGGKWNGECLGVGKKKFVGMSSHEHAESKEGHVHPHYTKRIKLGKEGIVLLVKQRNEKTRISLEGSENTLGSGVVRKDAGEGEVDATHGRNTGKFGQ
jgi:hypothetical protein